MPLTTKIHHDAETYVGLWTVTETQEQLKKNLYLSESEEKALQNFSQKKAMEWLAGRNLIKSLMHDDVPYKLAIIKNASGKPYIENSDACVSISHSHEKVASIVSSNHLVGIDVQRISPKIDKIAHKFLSPKELHQADTSSSPLLAKHIYWGAKECAFKCYGLGSVIFIDHILLDPIGNISKKGRFTGKFMKNDLLLQFVFFYSIQDNYVLVYALSTH